jgi:(4S)-4-hydroxy-5-phosphonooxypentane-2,3-dione isomerase
LNLVFYLLTLLKNETAMIVTCVYLKIKPDKIKGFIEVTSANHKESVKESGNLRFDLIQRADDPCQFMLYEAYESEAAAATHKTTAHYLKWRDLAEDFMAEPRVGVRYNIIEPSDRSKW